MNRYNRILNKNPREIVLLKSKPCFWGKCSFCDYIDDNDTNQEEIIKFNSRILQNVTGEFKSLEVINSASVFEIPMETLVEIKEIVDAKEIDTLYFESHYMYRERLDEITDFFDKQNVVFKCGIETFDREFRNHILKKGVTFKTPEEVSKYFSSICLMVGIKGQTKEMIANDIYIAKKNFPRVCINVYTENTTDIKPDPELIDWFKEEYAYLDTYENIEVLWENTDFGVGD